MSFNLLDHFILAQVMTFFVVFLRIGSALMWMPGFGDMYVSPRIRLLFALMFSLMLTPMLEPRMPVLPSSGWALAVIAASEILIGTFLGLIVRVMLMTVHVAGTMIAMQSSLAVAAIFDPATGSQSPVVSNMLTLALITLFFVLDLHHLALAALAQSYDVFPPTGLPKLEDMNILHIRLLADSFNLGVMLAAPHMIFALLFYLGGGLMTRLMPNFQVFFVMMPPQIMIALLLLILGMGLMLEIVTSFMETQLGNLIAVD